VPRDIIELRASKKVSEDISIGLLKFGTLCSHQTSLLRES
jgi:hypothetical protein